MTEIKRNRGQFIKGHSGNPSGRPKKKKPDKVSSSAIRERLFHVFIQAFTEKELLEFIKRSQKNKTLFLQEIRRMLPVTMEADVKAEFSPLQVNITSSDPKEIESSRIRLLEDKLERQQKFIDAYERVLKRHKLTPTLEHDPERPLQLAKDADGTFKTDAEKLLDEDDENEENPGNLPPADVVRRR